ncbi:sensor domain-containing diguanylate cyclase [Atopomonas sediminilitoris]|uniref:sensor domain-containing diguanylate cyclase n=1 Tax=Atopomonas sediminilitoris TaxID=2919919 RepID=UPI001F4E988B|nr:diguanylate cyclase [Atopomonas sediminilitoris]MCJ8168067.1 diguanylate cyclase [Atopomonas sediminilitoris]
MTVTDELKSFHWLLEIIHSVDVGVMVLDRSYQVDVWNGFMENHSGLAPDEVQGKTIFELFSEVDEAWLRRKVENVALLGTPAFSIWEQRPYLLRFKSYQPITGMADHMFQNVTMLPLKSTTGVVDHVGLVIYDVTDVAVNKQQLQEANLKLERLSRTDRLTQLFNRGYWEECLNTEYQRFMRYQQPLSLLIFDIDHFKKVNDTYGHPAGDEVIRQVADTLRSLVRNTDIAGRYGGEEFVCLMPDTPGEGGMVLAERIRQRIEQLLVVHEGREIRFTVSLGVAELTPEVPSPSAWLEQADKMLYQSKHGGRNQSSLLPK